VGPNKLNRDWVDHFRLSFLLLSEGPTDKSAFEDCWKYDRMFLTSHDLHNSKAEWSILTENCRFEKWDQHTWGVWMQMNGKFPWSDLLCLKNSQTEVFWGDPKLRLNLPHHQQTSWSTLTQKLLIREPKFTQINCSGTGVNEQSIWSVHGESPVRD
jgi:hypothetical protein